MIIVGIDPGLSGAICFFKSGNEMVVVDMPVLSLARGGKNRREIDERTLADLLSEPHHPLPDHIFVEQIWGRAHSDTSGFASAPLLIAYGIIRGVAAGLRIPLTKVSPQRWKRALAVPKGKDAARARASELMPEFTSLWRLKKHDGRAEAALLAMYGARELGLSVKKNPRLQSQPGISAIEQRHEIMREERSGKRDANVSPKSV